MAFNRERLFGISWRVALIILPWQTRWLHPAVLAGWPWEQGTLSAYVSWLPMVVTVFAGWPLAEHHVEKRTTRMMFACLFALAISSVFAVAFSGPATRQMRALAISQWWVQVILLSAFGLTLWRAAVDSRAVIQWFILSFVPHAVLGWGQYVFQSSPQNKWLGLAYHAGKELGDSVVQHGIYRVLRVYGGFPHPNIFGGWLALSVPLAMHAAMRASDKLRALFYSFAAAVLASVLVLTYSRSAWLAALAGLVFLAANVIRKRHAEKIDSQFLVVACVCVCLLAGTVIISQREHIFARVQSEDRLEVKSLSVRGNGLLQGVDLMRNKPVAGSGPNAVLLDVAATTANTPTAKEPLEPPHNAYLLALDETGVIGFLALIVLAVFIWRVSIMKMPLAVIGAIALFDHYPWSTWSGQALLMLCVLIACLPYTRKPEERSTA